MPPKFTMDFDGKMIVIKDLPSRHNNTLQILVGSQEVTPQKT